MPRLNFGAFPSLPWHFKSGARSHLSSMQSGTAFFCHAISTLTSTTGLNPSST